MVTEYDFICVMKYYSKYLWQVCGPDSFQETYIHGNVRTHCSKQHCGLSVFFKRTLKSFQPKQMNLSVFNMGGGGEKQSVNVNNVAD